MSAVRRFSPRSSLRSSDVTRAALVGALRWSRSAPAPALGVFKSDASENLLYQVCRAGRVTGFKEDPDLAIEHLTSADSTRVVMTGDYVLRVYEVAPGECVIGSGSEFIDKLRRLLLSPYRGMFYNRAPFAGLELARHVGNQEAELLFAVRCASTLAQQSRKLGQIWLRDVSLSAVTRRNLDDMLVNSDKGIASRAVDKNQIEGDRDSFGRLPRDTMNKMGQQLRAMYDDVIQQEIPEAFVAMLKRLDTAGSRES